jgi:hypothetical protein
VATGLASIADAGARNQIAAPRQRQSPFSSPGSGSLVPEQLPRLDAQPLRDPREALAHECGMGRTYLSGVERSERNVSVDNISWLRPCATRSRRMFLARMSRTPSCCPRLLRAQRRGGPAPWMLCCIDCAVAGATSARDYEPPLALALCLG